MKNHPIDRRLFLKTGALTAGLSTVIPANLMASVPKLNMSDSRIKLSLAAYSFNALFENAELTMEEFIDYCDDLKLDGTVLAKIFMGKKVIT